MSKRSPRNAASDSRTQPEAFLGLGPVVISAVGHLAEKYGPPLAEALYHAFKAEQKVFVQIDASWKVDSTYYVALSFRNLTEHGLYLEAISPEEPMNLQLDARHGYPSLGMDLSTDEDSDAAKHWFSTPPLTSVFPILLQPGVDHAERFTLRLLHGTDSELETFTLKMVFTQLDQPKLGKESKVIRLRQNGPKFAE